MLKKTKKGYYILEKFSRQGGIVHGFSSRKLGDCEVKTNSGNWENVVKFLTLLGLKRKDLVLMEQTYGDRIKVVNEKDRGKVISGVDALITQRKGVVLGIRTADCLPILFYDPTRKTIGIAHAGWRGVLRRIPQKIIELMIRLGSLPEEIIVGVGPHIGGCCYKVDLQRAERFRKEFGPLKGMIHKKKNEICLDLLIPTVNQLFHTGASRKNTEAASFCTSCQNQEFFSFRKDSKKTFGEMLGIVGLVDFDPGSR